MFRSAQNKRLNITTAICAQPSKEVVRISLEKVSSCLEVRVVKTGSENCFQCKEICQNFSNVPSYPISRDWKVNTYSNSHGMRFQGQSWFKLSFFPFLYLYCRRQDDVTDDSPIHQQRHFKSTSTWKFALMFCPAHQLKSGIYKSQVVIGGSKLSHTNFSSIWCQNFISWPWN